MAEQTSHELDFDDQEKPGSRRQRKRRRQRCAGCGAMNRRDHERCRICTRPLRYSGSTAATAQQEAIYRGPVSPRYSGRSGVGPAVLLIALLAVLVPANYYWLGLGPAWMHGAESSSGPAWVEVSAEDGRFSAAMPVEPMTGDAAAQLAPATLELVGAETYVAGVDSEGVRISSVEDSDDFYEEVPALYSFFVVPTPGASEDENSEALLRQFEGGFGSATGLEVQQQSSEYSGSDAGAELSVSVDYVPDGEAVHERDRIVAVDDCLVILAVVFTDSSADPERFLDSLRYEG
ncbi:MAG: hypothetical protein EDR02_10225 [Actinobacteria bacterium]|nr:MAG: hypothetical protein EDR02_10225 [Actinomycetota bacterium]RIK05009.1 MAG: hypothetical protein DCC48_11715 [Acidobacteriota bacterium]